MRIPERKLSLAEIEAKTGIRFSKLRRKTVEPYVQRIPVAWLQVAAKLPGKSLHVAVVVWYRWHLEKRPAISLTKSKLARFGVERHAASRALDRLETAGLVNVKRAKGRSPRVTIVSVPAPETRKPQ
jgi:hypothetical protein